MKLIKISTFRAKDANVKFTEGGIVFAKSPRQMNNIMISQIYDNQSTLIICFLYTHKHCNNTFITPRVSDETQYLAS